MSSIIRATLGFVFDPLFQQVVLIQKNRPEWQKGDINGLGGKCEGTETFTHCIAREVKEEAGIWIPSQNWRKHAQLKWENWNVTVFAAVFVGDLKQVQSVTDEVVAWYSVLALPSSVKKNLPWLIPMGIDALKNNELKLITAVY